ncbi:MAG: hypothetical protein L0Y58_06720, partial [Verrucomicrobia subdivision 3 bacterium]|nr:hypothetical protein [Limisphaerales bacterium]
MAANSASGLIFMVTTNGDSGPGSLRQAILDANATPGPDEIHFSIGGVGPHGIRLQSDLPTITDAVNIDGRTQPGYANGPIVVLDGTILGMSSGPGLRLECTGSSIVGLVISWFRGGPGILISGQGGH